MEVKFTDENFEKEVLDTSGTVLVDFYADWCGPCKMMAPVVEELAEEYQGKAKVGKLNIDECPNTANRYGVRNIPTFIVFKDGTPVETIVGGVSKDQLASFLDD